MQRAYYSATIKDFILASPESVLGKLVLNNDFSLEQTQRDAWSEQIVLLKSVLSDYDGAIYFEFSIPRMGKRIDTVLLIGPVIFVLEFKVGESSVNSSAVNQVWDYALDLKNFHQQSHDRYVAPILIPTRLQKNGFSVAATHHNDKLLFPISCGADMLRPVIEEVLRFCDGDPIDSELWGQGSYHPTPTIVEAAMALYRGHSVKEISRSDALAINLSRTSEAISGIIEASRDRKLKSICFVTGVPGAGKTLVGLDIANQHTDTSSELYSVFLSGNKPLVDILREALARDRVKSEKEKGIRLTKGSALSEVKRFIQNVHHFRDECLIDIDKPPIEHVALFDEAQRAWNLTQTANFMRMKKKRPDFNQSEPEFLISCLDRHEDWAVVVCLVGGGQEINTGEAGISEWIASLNRSFPDWHIHISSNLRDAEYGAGQVLREIDNRPHVSINESLHLSVSMRSFRAENVSLLVKQLLDLEIESARKTLSQLASKYPIVITRDLLKAKDWLKKMARGTERYGIVVSSKAQRLKPYAIDVKSPMNPIHWFLDDRDDVRSSYYLEDVATEFHVQGLELDWACVTWDADFRFSLDRWENWSFTGDRWNRIRKPEIQTYQKNAYRVLLTRARQGMVIVVPDGDPQDPTRNSHFYDPTFQYLERIGFNVID